MIFILKKLMDNKEYFGEKENEGYARLERLNQEKHFFETIGRNKRFTNRHLRIRCL